MTALTACNPASAAALLESSRDEGMDREGKNGAQKLAGYLKSFRSEHRATGATALKQLRAAGPAYYPGRPGRPGHAASSGSGAGKLDYDDKRVPWRWRALSTAHPA